MQQYQQNSYNRGLQEANGIVEEALSKAEERYFYQQGFNQGIIDSVKSCIVIAEELGGEELKSLFLKELGELGLKV